MHKRLLHHLDRQIPTQNTLPRHQRIQLPPLPLPPAPPPNLRLQFPNATPHRQPAPLQDALAETVAVEAVLAGREDEELAAQQRESAQSAALPRFDDGVAAVEVLDVGFDALGCGGRGVHFGFEGGDGAGVGFEGGADFVFEVVDDDEVREEGDEVFDAE